MPQCLDDEYRIRPATPADQSWIQCINRKFSGELGFVPRAAVHYHIEHGHYTLLVLRGQLAAFSLTTGGKQSPVRIIQHAVDDELWRLGYGQRLLEANALKATRCPRTQLVLTCRDGLLANDFWQATGGTLNAVSPGGHRRQKMLLHWTYDKNNIERLADSARHDPRIDDLNLRPSDYSIIKNPPDGLWITQNGTLVPAFG